MTTQEEKEPQAPDSWKCLYCPRTFEQISAAEEHVRKEHAIYSDASVTREELGMSDAACRAFLSEVNTPVAGMLFSFDSLPENNQRGWIAAIRAIRNYRSPGESTVQRYRREAKGRLADRIGPALAEEFTSVAADTLLDVVNVAELMAAAYRMGKEGRPGDGR